MCFLQQNGLPPREVERMLSVSISPVVNFITVGLLLISPDVSARSENPQRLLTPETHVPRIFQEDTRYDWRRSTVEYGSGEDDPLILVVLRDPTESGAKLARAYITCADASADLPVDSFRSINLDDSMGACAVEGAESYVRLRLSVVMTDGQTRVVYAYLNVQIGLWMFFWEQDGYDERKVDVTILPRSGDSSPNP